MTTDDIDRLYEHFLISCIIEKKIEAIVGQAKGYFEIEKDFGSFSDFLWSYVDHQPI